MSIRAYDRTIQIGGMFQTGAENVYMAMLMACGCSQDEAECVVYGDGGSPSVEALKMRASRRIKDNPGILECVKWLKASKLGVQASLVQDIGKGGQTRKRPKSQKDYRNKDILIEELSIQADCATSPKEKSDILMKIADLQRMKQDETKDEEELVHFYLPLTCEKCSLYRDAEERK
jgi:hypothetical protein